MKRFATLFTLAAVALAACQDTAPTGPGAGPSTLAAPGAAGLAAVLPASYPLGSVTTYQGNTGKTPAGTCPAGTLTYKQEGATGNNDIFGFDFDVSGDGKYLSFSSVKGGYAIVAVLVKGGPAFNAYTYANPVAHDEQLRSPTNRGGNVPEISHYVVCAAPAPDVEKKFDHATAGITMESAHPVDFMEMAGTPCVKAVTGTYPGCLPVLKGETIWMVYRITYSSPVAGTLTDDIAQICTALNNYNTNGGYTPANFGCSFGGFFADAGLTQKLGASSYAFGPGSGTVYALIDITNPNECGDRPVVNTVTLKAGPFTDTSTETVWIWPQGDKCMH